MHMTRTWSYQGEACRIPVNASRYSKTCFASIGNCLNTGFCITLDQGTDAPSFKRHLVKLKQGLRDQEVKPYLVIDNARAHVAAELRDYLVENFVPLYLPAYSPEFNSVGKYLNIQRDSIRCVSDV